MISTLISISVTLLLIPLSKNLTKVFEQKSFEGLIYLALSVISVYILRGLFNYLQSYFTAILSFNYITELRQKLYNRILNHSYEYNYLVNSGKLTVNLTDDTENIKQMIFSTVTELIPGVITVTFTLIYAFYLNWRLALLIFILVPLISFIINLFSSLIKKKSEEAQFSLEKIFSLIQQTFSNMTIIKSNAYENYKLKEYIDLHNHLKSNSIKVINYISLQPSVINTVQVTGISIIACFGAYQVFNNNMKLEDLIAFATTLSLTIEPAIFITKSLGIISKSKISFINVKNTILLLEKNQQVFNEKRFKGNYEIIIENLNFKYSDTHSNFSIQDLNLNIRQGEKILLKGENGSGKSTLLKILLRLIDNYQGIVKIGNNDIKDLSRDELKKILSVSFSEPFLFNESIKKNIILDKNINEDLFNKVCEVSGVNEFINNFEKGFETIVDIKGDNLSSGQKQKISIARAIISNPRILILDEATSSIDINSELQIYNSIKEFLPDSTIIIVTHKNEIPYIVERIIYLDKK